MKISVEQYLIRLSNDLKLPNFYSIITQGQYRLQLPEIEPIEIFETRENIMMTAPVAELLDGLDEEKLFSYLMYANFLGQGTARSSLSLHPNDKTLILSNYTYVDIDYSYFKDLIEEFFNYVDYMKTHLATKIPTFLKEPT